MIISSMRFDSFEWRHNPLNVEISFSREMSRSNLAGAGSIAKPAGVSLRVVKGKGEFAGKDCLKQYEKLCALFGKGSKALLSLPFGNPFYAYFTDLCLKGDASPDLITYTFEFTEAQSSVKKKNSAGIVQAKEGETLFDIAYDYSVSVDELVLLNPHIKRPDEIPAGTEVRLC